MDEARELASPVRVGVATRIVKRLSPCLSALFPEFPLEPVTQGVSETASLRPSPDDHRANLGSLENRASADFSSVYTRRVYYLLTANPPS